MFTDAIDYLNTYRTQRLDGLKNVKRQRWFTSEVDTLDELVTTFESTDEDAEWEALEHQGAPGTPGYDLRHYQAVRIKIAFLTGMRHDVRGQFAVGVDDDPKTNCDFDRHAFSDVNGAKYKTDHLAVVVNGKAGA